VSGAEIADPVIPHPLGHPIAHQPFEPSALGHISIEIQSTPPLRDNAS
jgi:hypothetical protein